MLTFIKYPKGMDRTKFIKYIESDMVQSTMKCRGIPIVGHCCVYHSDSLNNFIEVFLSPDRYIGYVKNITFDPIPPNMDYIEFDLLDNQAGRLAKELVTDQETEYSISPCCIVNPLDGSLKLLGFTIHFE